MKVHVQCYECRKQIAAKGDVYVRYTEGNHLVLVCKKCNFPDEVC